MQQREETSNVLAYSHVANDPSDMEQVADEDELRLWEFLSELPSLTPQCLQDAERGALSQMTHVRMRIYDCIIDNETGFGLVEESTFSKKNLNDCPNGVRVREEVKDIFIPSNALYQSSEHFSWDNLEWKWTANGNS